MAHMIDETTGQAAIAYAGDEPWHGLGQTIDPGDDLDTIAKKAGCAHEVLNAPALFMPGGFAARNVPDRKVLYRSDTLAPLSVVSRDYQVVQPRECLAFFDEMVKSGGFHIETAGALSGGKRIWALARLGDGANVIGQDKVRPFVLLATSYDGSMATLAKYVNERVVCHNTITAALGEDGFEVKVYHNRKFDAAAVRRDMGIAVNAFDAWLIRARRMASCPVPTAKAEELTGTLMAPLTKMEDVTKSRGYQGVMALFQGQAIGSGHTQGGTAWQWLNAVTEYVDHSRGRSADTRMNSAWFGEGDRLKTKAETMAAELVS